jgi:hypothetical protein
MTVSVDDRPVTASSTANAGRRWFDRGAVLRWIGVGLPLLLLLNVAGVARYPGGPLRDPSDDGLFALDIRPADQGYNEISNDPVDWAATGEPLYFGAVYLENPWPVGAAIEGVRPLELTPGLTLDRALVGIPPDGTSSMGWGDRQLLTEAALDETFGGALSPLPVTVPAATAADRATNVLLVLSAATPGRYGFRGVEIDYRVGPFTFHATQHIALDACIGPFPPGQECSTGG